MLNLFNSIGLFWNSEKVFTSNSVENSFLYHLSACRQFHSQSYFYLLEFWKSRYRKYLSSDRLPLIHHQCHRCFEVFPFWYKSLFPSSYSLFEITPQSLVFWNSALLFLVILFQNSLLFQSPCEFFCSNKCYKSKNKTQNCKSFHHFSFLKHCSKLLRRYRVFYNSK